MSLSPNRRELAFARFKEARGSYMSTTKWYKLLGVLNDLLPEEYKHSLYYTAWDGLDEEKPCVVGRWGRLISGEDIVYGTEGACVQDGAIGCPFLLRELWELAIPIRAQEETVYPTGKSHAAEKVLFPAYLEFLEELQKVAIFPYEITNKYTQRPFRRVRSTVTTWQFIVFYGYGREGSILF